MDVEFVGIDPAVIQELAAGRHAREVLESKKLQNRFQQLAKSPDPSKAHEVLGQPTMSIDPLSYHYWGRRLGYECWADKQFRREYARDVPGARIAATGGTKIQVGYSGDNKRFVKTYAAK